MIFAAFFFLAAPAAQAAIDFTQIPVTVCPTWQAVSNSAGSCAHNDNFLKATRGCLDHIESLEKTLAQPAQAIANAARGSQSKDLQSAQASYQYTDAALAYLLKVAHVAYAQVQEYSLYVLPPSDDEAPGNAGGDMSWMSGTECYGGTERKLSALQAEFGAKIQRLEARRRQAKAYDQALTGSGTDMGSLNTVAPPAAATKAPAATRTPKPGVPQDYRSSGISGTEAIKKH